MPTHVHTSHCPAAHLPLPVSVIVRLGSEKGMEFGKRCAACYVYGKAEEDCESDRTRVESGNYVCDIEDEYFDGTRNMIEYVWKGEPPVLQNRVSCYEDTLKRRVRIEFEMEVDQWIEESILRHGRKKRKRCVTLNNCDPAYEEPSVGKLSGFGGA